MFETLWAFWTDPLVYALNPLFHLVLLIGFGMALGSTILLLWGAIRGVRLLILIASFMTVVSWTLAYSGIASTVHDAHALRAVLAGADIDVTFDVSHVTLKRSLGGDHPSEVKVRISRVFLPNIETALTKESPDLAARLKAVARQADFAPQEPDSVPPPAQP